MRCQGLSRPCGGTVIACGLIACTALMPARSAAEGTIERIASLTLDGVSASAPLAGTREPRPAITDDGSVVFAGLNLSFDPNAGAGQQVFVGEGPGNLSVLDVQALGLTQIRSVRSDAGSVLLLADKAGNTRGVYTLPVDDDASLNTIYESSVACPSSGAPMGPSHPRYNVGLASDGQLAFSTICNGEGALYRGTLSTAASVLHQGSGSGGLPYNTMELDLNESGQVAIQSEYLATNSRAIFVFETPGQTVNDVSTAIDGLGIGTQPMPRINQAGDVAYLSGGALWTVTPTPYGSPKLPLLVADTLGDFASIGYFEINASGLVAFEAELDDGRRGVFVGPDAVLDRVLVEGEIVDGGTLTEVSLGGLNDAGEMALRARVSTDPQLKADVRVYRVTGTALGHAPFVPPDLDEIRAACATPKCKPWVKSKIDSVINPPLRGLVMLPSAELNGQR